MDFTFPEAPAAFLELKKLEELYGQVIDWSWDASENLSRMRSKGYALVMKKLPINERIRGFILVDEKYYGRLKEIDETVEAFRIAYVECKKNIDYDVVLEYSALILPLLKQRNAHEAELQGPKWKLKIAESDAKRKVNEEKRAKRRLNGKKSRGSRNISEADRQEKAADEGAGN